MSNRAMTLVRKRTFDFSDNVAGFDVSITAVEACDVACFGDALMLVRVHSIDVTAGDSTILVEAYNTAPSDEDPDTDFVEADAAASVELLDSTPAGSLLLSGVAAAFGPALQIRVTGNRAGGATVRAELSIELVGRAGVAAPRRSLADTLVVGNQTDGTDIIVSSTDEVRGEDGGSPTALAVRGGDASGNSTGGAASVLGGAGSGTGSGGDLTLGGGTGGATSGNGGNVSVSGGASTNAIGGTVTLNAGDGSTDDGDIDLLTPSTAGAVRIRTQATFTSTRWEHLTFGTQQAIGPLGTYDVVVAAIPTNGRNMMIDLYVTAHQSGTDTSVRAARIIQTAYRSGGVVSLLAAHLSSTTGNGTFSTDPLSFQLVVSGDNIILRTTNGHATSTRTANLAYHWSRQGGGFPV